jgi:hypothetical protein
MMHAAPRKSVAWCAFMLKLRTTFAWGALVEPVTLFVCPRGAVAVLRLHSNTAQPDTLFDAHPDHTYTQYAGPNAL